MKKADFNSNTLSKDLAERVKELECLYNISRIAVKHKNNLSSALALIIEEIPSGWQYPHLVKAYLRYGDTEIGVRPKQEKCQSVLFEFGQGLTGELFVYYQQSYQTEIPEVFLIEEQALLNQIGYEILSLIELDLTKQQEVIIKDKLRFNDRLNLLGELTAGIAHELNTPLGNIIGYAELLQKGEKDPLKKNDVDTLLWLE